MSGEATVRREVALALEEFGRTALQSRARALEIPVEALVRQAVLYYLAVRGSERAAGTVPRFARDRVIPSTTFNVELELEESDWSALEVEAVHKRLPMERLIEHAALLFLADIDSGRVAVRIVEEEDEESEQS